MDRKIHSALRFSIALHQSTGTPSVSDIYDCEDSNEEEVYGQFEEGEEQGYLNNGVHVGQQAVHAHFQKHDECSADVFPHIWFLIRCQCKKVLQHENISRIPKSKDK